MSWQEKSCNSFFPPRLKEHHKFNRRRQTTTCVIHVEMRSECSDQVANQQPAADPQHSENKEAAARRLMSKNRKSSAARQKTPSSSSSDTQTHKKQHVHDTTRAPEPSGPSGPPCRTSHLSLRSRRPSLSVFYRLFPRCVFPNNKERRGRSSATVSLRSFPSSLRLVLCFYHECQLLFGL